MGKKDGKGGVLGKKSPGLFIGTSGWNYKDWKDAFYAGVKQKEWLEHYARNFNAVEVNATFYRLLQDKVVTGWAKRSPDNFSFAIKGSRYITHNKRLKDSAESVKKQKDNMSALQHKIPAVVWQLPANFSKDLDRLRDFAENLGHWPESRHALEFRDTSWFDEETADLLGRYSLANCISDAEKWPRWDSVCTDMVYVRLHGNTETYHSSYSEKELGGWAQKIRAWLDEARSVHVYFDNTDARAAPGNALRLKELLRH